MSRNIHLDKHWIVVACVVWGIVIGVVVAAPVWWLVQALATAGHL